MIDPPTAYDVMSLLGEALERFSKHIYARLQENTVGRGSDCTARLGGSKRGTSSH